MSAVSKPPEFACAVDVEASTTEEDTSPRAVVERFLAANRSLEVEGMFEEISQDAVWVLPAAAASAPRDVSGKEANRGFFESIRPMWAHVRPDLHRRAPARRR